MKNKLPALLACFLLLNAMLSAQIRFEQLTEVNPFWQGKESFFRHADKSALLASTILTEQQLVATHLRLVWQYLTGNVPEGLKTAQLKNRENCLSILDGYIQTGIFPKNLYHAKRTPYFIDDFGTACAVGYLIIQTGGKSIAEGAAAICPPYFMILRGC